MSFQHVDGTDLSYHLISYDKKGIEKRSVDGALESEAVCQLAADSTAPVTDIFFLSHGWLSDQPGAIDQFNRWIGAMAECAHDLAAAKARTGGFRPLIIGLHWPSLPWGDEHLASESSGRVHFASSDLLRTESVDEAVSAYVDRLIDDPSDSAPLEKALRTILVAAQAHPNAQNLSDEVKRAYETIRKAAGLTGDEDMSTASDHTPTEWNANVIYNRSLHAETLEALEFLGSGKGNGVKNAILAPLRQLSFWKMKHRARAFGESGAANLLRAIQASVSTTSTRFHLMGHSFGCIVVSAAVAGGKQSPAIRPVGSLFLVQGALSLWSLCPDIPSEPGTPGYFRPIIAKGLVHGPIVTTLSSHDRAVGTFYPMAARFEPVGTAAWPQQTELPKYGVIPARRR